MIRKYEEKDLGDLLAVWESASELAHPFLSKEFIASERKNIRDLYLPNTETWVHEEGGRVIGFLSLMGIEVGAIFVQPSHHGQGVGRGLMDKARELRGELEVEVFTDNAIGRAFYQHYGFEFLEEKVHEPTGFGLQRLRLSSPKAVS